MVVKSTVNLTIIAEPLWFEFQEKLINYSIIYNILKIEFINDIVWECTIFKILESLNKKITVPDSYGFYFYMKKFEIQNLKLCMEILNIYIFIHFF